MENEREFVSVKNFIFISFYSFITSIMFISINESRERIILHLSMQDLIINIVIFSVYFLIILLIYQSILSFINKKLSFSSSVVIKILLFIGIVYLSIMKFKVHDGILFSSFLAIYLVKEIVYD